MIPRGLVPEQLEAEAVEGVRPETCQGRLWISGFQAFKTPSAIYNDEKAEIDSDNGVCKHV